MYVSCSCTNCVYACCTIGSVCICGKIMFLAMVFAKRDFKSA
jgi:hypothetical protein